MTKQQLIERVAAKTELKKSDAEVAVDSVLALIAEEADELPEFEPSLVQIEDVRIVAASGVTHYANVIFNGRSDSRVAGSVFEISDAELVAADGYERIANYKRIAATLASGKHAWLYVDGRPSDRRSPQ